MENLISVVIVTTTISVMLPLFFSEKEQNINQSFLNEAISLSKEHLDDLRRRKILDLPLGEESTTKEDNLGQSYDLKQYICTQEPIINSDNSVTCPTTVNDNNNLRHILLRVEKNGKQIYKVQTAFTRLR
ncbi:type II secretion system protein [Crocosphaera sp. Alani8]|uniref:type II secretion system protein n=1 Tax=Crocosphaera sp. Alani8 TaxID=3038952 RepID=UPI00313F3BB5